MVVEGERSIVRANEGDTRYERVWYVLSFPWGAVTYEPARDAREYASVNVHARERTSEGQSHRAGEPCEFLADEQACYFDGTSLFPAQPDEDAIWRSLEAWARGWAP